MGQTGLKGLQADEELEIGILLDLLHQFLIGESQASLDDQRTERHSEWLGGCSKTLAELRRVIIFQVIPRNECCQLDPAIVARELATKWQEEVLKRELMTRLASVHVENPGRFFGANAPNCEHFTWRNRSDPLQRRLSALSQEALRSFPSYHQICLSVEQDR